MARMLQVRQHKTLGSQSTGSAENQWGVATFVREGLAEPMDGDDAKTASLAGKLYSDAVEQAQEPQHSAGGATVGQYLRKKWRQVCLDTPCLPQCLHGWR